MTILHGNLPVIKKILYNMKLAILTGSASQWKAKSRLYIIDVLKLVKLALL
jgi:hypothetical protein